MKKKYKYAVYLQMFNEEMPESGVEVVPAAEEQPSSEPTGSNDKVDVAFSKRLSSAQEKWNAEKEKEIQDIKDQYKDYDTYKEVAEYTREANGYDNIMSVKEQIELVKLQERAEQENISPDQLKRIEALEAKAAKADELEATFNANKEVAEFEKTLTEFSDGKELDGKPLDHKELWQFMHDNGVANPDIAFKAMKADALEAKLATAKEDSIKEYLGTKTGVKTRSDGATAQSLPVDNSKGFKGAEQAAIARLRAARQGNL